ncbi:MAG TPA: apolipoprotein N-acyltransferase [Bryobacteraceae bacterium]
MLNWLLALGTAGLLVLAFPGFDFAWLAAVALAPLLVAVAREPRPWRRFLLGWACGIVYWFGVCHWIQFTLAVHGGMGNATGWAVFTLFALVKGLHMAVFALLAGMLTGRWWATPAVAALWVALESTHGFFGFAWLALGNAAIDMSVPLRLAPYTGVYGVSFVFAMIAAALALRLLGRPRKELAWMAALLLLFLLPPLPDAQPGRETALLVQPDLSETEDWTNEAADRAQRTMAEDTVRGAAIEGAHPPSIVVWPEVPAPFYYDEDPVFRARTADLARITRAYLLMGTVAYTPAGAPLNSATLVSPEGFRVSRYDKVNLVPFGEFVPWPFGALTQKISKEAGDFAAGRGVVVSPVGNHKIGAFICYESVFPNFVRRFAADGAEALVNISNDGWFGKTAARRQHLEIVRMRAVENRRWILRAANDGITAAIDPAGRVLSTLPLFVEATSIVHFNYETAETFYTRHGDWFAWLCALLVAACLAAAKLARG